MGRLDSGKPVLSIYCCLNLPRRLLTVWNNQRMGLGLVCYTSSLPSNSCLTVFFFFIAFHSSSLLLYRHWMAIQKYFSKCQSISAGCKSRLPWQPKSYRQIYNFMSPTQYHAICSSQKSGVCHQLSLISAGLTGMGSLRMSRP